jgi:hypothetical protein
LNGWRGAGHAGNTLPLKDIRHDIIATTLLASAPATHGVHVRFFGGPRSTPWLHPAH